MIWLPPATRIPHPDWRPFMTRTAVFIVMVMAVSTSALAQGGRGAPAPPAPLEAGAWQADVDKAVLALPEHLRNHVMVISSKLHYIYDPLRKGSQGLVCFDRSSF